MFYEVFIPAAGDGFDVTITVEADNWMTALKSGLERTGQGAEAIRNVMCDIKDDNTIHVTDAGTRRVFVLREVDEAPVDEVADAETHKMAPVEFPQPQAAAAEPAPEPEPEPEPEPARGPLSTTSQSHAVKVPPPAAAPHPVSAQTEVASDSDTQRSKPFVPPPAAAPPVVSRDDDDATQPISVAAEPPQSSAPAEPAPPPADREPQPALGQPSGALEPAAQSDDELASSWTYDDGRMRIGSSSFKALKREDEETKVVREERVPTGQREAVQARRVTDEKVSSSVLEEVFLEIQQIHEQKMSMEQVINFVMDLCMLKISADAGSILFVDVNGRELYFATARGPKAHEVMGFRVPMGVGIVGFCAKEGVSLTISDAHDDPRFYPDIAEALGYPTTNICCAPVQYEGRVYGAIELMSPSHRFGSAEVNVISYIGHQLAKFVHDLIMAREKLE